MTTNTSLIATINALPKTPGVYLFRNASGKVIYVGKSVSLRDRVKSYFDNIKHLEPKTKKLVSAIVKIDHIKTETELEALILEAALIKQYQPRYNIQGKDDKNFFYIEIANAKLRKTKGVKYLVDRQLWPAIKLTHQPKNLTSLYFGPFISGQEIKQALKVLRRIFKWCQYSSQASLKRHGNKACFYRQINLCPGICDNTIDLKTYWQSFDQLILFLAGKKQSAIKDLEKQMHELAKKEQFEQAAETRDLIKRLETLTSKYHSPADYLKNPNLIEDVRRQQLNNLMKLINQTSSQLIASNNSTNCQPKADTVEPKVDIANQSVALQHNRADTNSSGSNGQMSKPLIIEAYDISHLGTEYGVGSQVVFVDGLPNKSKYRRYKLKTQVPNDYQALAEVLTRRFKKNDDLPDLIVIDGGKGQVAKVQAIADKLNINTPIVGLAKHPDRLVVYNYSSQQYQLIKLDNQPAKYLLQHLRDEAHRFANQYRKKVMKKQNE